MSGTVVRMNVLKLCFCIIITLSIIPSTRAGDIDKLFNVADSSVSGLPEIIPELKKTKIIFLGELHDNMQHHKAQLRVLHELHKIGLPIAVGLEMFQAQHQSVLDDWTSGKTGIRQFVRSYYQNWTIPWPLYRDIFLYVREHEIPLIGLNVPPEITRQVAKKGFDSLTKEQMRDIPGASCSVDPEYEAFIRRAIGMHDDDKSFKHFCEAQMVWDTAMAWNVVNFIKENPERVVVVLAGGGHAWKPGIPSQVQKHIQVPIKVVLPELSIKYDIETVTTNETDYLWLGI